MFRRKTFLACIGRFISICELYLYCVFTFMIRILLQWGWLFLIMVKFNGSNVQAFSDTSLTITLQCTQHSQIIVNLFYYTLLFWAIITLRSGLVSLIRCSKSSILGSVRCIVGTKHLSECVLEQVECKHFGKVHKTFIFLKERNGSN